MYCKSEFCLQVVGCCGRGLDLILLLLDLLQPACPIHLPTSTLQAPRPKQPISRGGFQGIGREQHRGEGRGRRPSHFRRRGGEVERVCTFFPEKPFYWQVGLRALNTYSGQVVAVVVEDASLVSSSKYIAISSALLAVFIMPQ